MVYGMTEAPGSVASTSPHYHLSRFLFYVSWLAEDQEEALVIALCYYSAIKVGSSIMVLCLEVIDWCLHLASLGIYIH